MIPLPPPTLEQNKVKCVSSNHKKQLYSYGSSTLSKTAGCFTAEAAVWDVAVEAEFIVSEGNLGPGIARRETATQLKFEVSVQTFVLTPCKKRTYSRNASHILRT